MRVYMNFESNVNLNKKTGIKESNFITLKDDPLFVIT